MPATATGLTIDAEYFRNLYRRDADPWHFETSEYEREKYRATLNVLPQERYRNALELGCSIGVFTSLLAPRCERLLAVDVSSDALNRARSRCMGFRSVDFAEVDLRNGFPQDEYDLVTFSEIGYYFGTEDLDRIRASIAASLAPGGTLVLVHWTPPVEGHATPAEEVHRLFLETPQLVHALRRDAPTYRLDLFVRR